MELEIGKKYFLDIDGFEETEEGRRSTEFCSLFRKTNRMIYVSMGPPRKFRFHVDEEHANKMAHWSEFFTVGEESEFLKFLSMPAPPRIPLLEFEIIGLDAE